MNYSYLPIAAFAATMLGIASHASAGGYVGGSIGQASVDLCNEARAIGATRCDDEDTGFKLIGGYNFTDNFAVEGSYADFGSVSARATGLHVRADATALAIAGKGTVALSDALSVFAKAGFARWDADVSVTGIGGDDDSGTDLLYGVGGEYSFSERLAIRGEWERTDADGDDIDLLSIGLIYSF
jgi:OOP family OmpA-OmpF porin